MDRAPSTELVQAPDQELDSQEIYSYIYDLSKRDFRGVRVRNFARKSFSVLVLILSAAGIFFTAFYFLILRNYIENLRSENLLYRNSIEAANSEIVRLTETEYEYRQKISEYRDTFSKLRFENEQLIDFDLTERVQQNLTEVDEIQAEYRNIFRGNTAFRETALTFDLGTGEDLPYVYTVLKRFGIRATIFVSNEMSSTSYGSLFREKNLYYLSKLRDLGCEFGNHTWSHYNLKDSLYETSRRKRLALSFVSDDVLSEAALGMEFDRVKRHLFTATGITLAPLWRAPYGAIDRRILTSAAAAGYPNHVFWSANREGPLDFYDYVKKRMVRVKSDRAPGFVLQKNPFYFSSAEMLARLKQWEETDPHGLNGAIAICHLGTGRKTDKVIYILPEFISHCRSKGYSFVTVSALLNDVQD